MIKLGSTIRQRRNVLGLRQSSLADLTGVSTRTIQLVEQGKGNPSLETLLNLMDSLGLQLELTLKDPAKLDDV
ncbi:helix-turn-helix transcriptional regulator [Chitinophaga agrisoli]|uniref:Helix-turn-helix transcriptional regulator n=2 Tax=Chitinophaga agrisoli TaxID=2607653 RepID=A0A5B2VYX4_9BACT|nr:helix-turn-helix transcriptional regulator [Chitinophaga agrisoli]